VEDAIHTRTIDAAMDQHVIAGWLISP